MNIRVGVIYQDVTSLGFLEGLKKRLGCNAEFVTPPPTVGAPKFLTRKKARLAADYFRRKGVSIVLRFTDADGERWQEVKRLELEAFPEDLKELVICGVAVNCPEDWLRLDAAYLSGQLGIDSALWAGHLDCSGTVKAAIDRAAGSSAKVDFVAMLISEAPLSVFKQWLQDDALRQFYQDCRAIANRFNCPISSTEL